jgi:hypothetical protein
MIKIKQKIFQNSKSECWNHEKIRILDEKVSELLKRSIQYQQRELNLKLRF